MPKALVHGAGGFGREVAWLLQDLAAKRWELVAFLEDAGGAKIGSSLNGIPVIAAEAADVAGADAVFVAIGEPGVRRRVTERLAARGAQFASVVAGDVIVHGSNRIGPGSIVCRGTILTVNVTIGAHAHVNLDCTIGHDAVLEDYTTLAPGVHVSGYVKIGEGAYIGTGASLINGRQAAMLEIGRGSVVAAGATVTGNVPPGVLVAGVPAVVKKRL
jgi:sugar O-acyltransferase (sialic acid O-acetyltransferase NeuD family)